MILYSLAGDRADAPKFALRRELCNGRPEQIETVHKSWVLHPGFNWLNYRDACDWILLATSCLSIFFEEEGYDSPFDAASVALGFVPDYAHFSTEGHFNGNPVNVHVGKLDGVAFFLSILTQWGNWSEDASLKVGIDPRINGSRHAKLSTRLKDLTRFLPAAPTGLLNNWDADVLDAIEAQWAPQYARYCWNCGDLSTRFWSARHFEEGSCPHCGRQLSFEFRVPPTFTLEAYVEGTPRARPWFGDLSGLPHRAENLTVEQVLPLSLQTALLKRKGQDGWTCRTPVGIFPKNSKQLDSLYATIRPHGWSLEVKTVEGKIAVCDERLRRRYGILWVPNEDDIDSELPGMSLMQAAGTLVKSGAQTVCSTTNARWFLDSMAD